MFKITPIKDLNEQKAIAEKCGAEYRDGFFGYKMIDNDSGELMGFSQFEIEGEYGYISDLKERIGYDDFEAMFILARQTMNFIDICGTHKCRADKSTSDERLLRAAGFKLTGSEYLCDMQSMFDGHCSGETVKL